MQPTALLTVADVAAALSISRSRVLQLDDELQPIRVRGARRYDPRIVEKLAKLRLAALSD